MFLEWLEGTQKKGINLTLNAASRKKDNVREVFTRGTGEDVDALWREYIGSVK
ncbi:MAG: hypothetical protein H0W78_07060 [Planctomycetes bacterium]|nr:hypothetical protein [Planctomycetota bacterium]